MNNILTGLLLVAGVSAILWGVELYRSNFVKRDLLTGIAVGGALILLAIVPEVYDIIGAALSLSNRVVTLTLLGYLFLLVMVFYLYTALWNTKQEVAELSRSLSISETTSEPQVDGGNRPISIVIPAYNEGETIESVLESLPEQIEDYPVEPIVISDGSEDDTAIRAVNTGATVAEHPLNQGQGGAIRTGFQIADQKDAKVVVTMDADGQHPVEELPNLVRPVLKGEAGYVMGSRYLGVDKTGNSVVRKSGIRFFSWLINRLTKSKITDCTNGYRAIRGSEIEEFTLTEERFSAPELIIEARKNGLRVKEIPMVIKEREAGETKKPQLGYALGLGRTILTAWIR